MIERKLNPAELAKELHHHPGLVYEWLNCEHIPRPSSFARIADALFVDKQELLGSFPVGD